MLNRLKTFLKSQNNADVLKRQKFFIGMLCFVCFGILYLFIFGGESKRPSSFKKQEIKKVDIQSGGKRVDPQEVWKYKIEDEGKGLKKDLTELKTLIGEQLSLNEQKLNAENTFLRERLEALEEKVEAHQLKNNGENQSDGRFASREFVSRGVTSRGIAGSDDSFDQQHPNQITGIQKISLTLKGPEGTFIKTIDNTIPAGSFAKAKLLAGVDASTAMNASSDPRPMLLRIVDWGSLPRRFKSDLKDCRCTASTYGDISSERVYVRLEKLTCIERETGEIVETEVAGYVAGSDGRAGIRGKVVSRDAAYLGRGLMSGVLGGLASIASPNKTTPNMTIGLGTSTVETPSKGELFSSGMASGGSQALDRLSHYYIDRAEQLQPVVQVCAGQFVDVIFTEGVSIGDTNVKREISKVRDAARLRAAERAGARHSDLSINGEENNG